MTEQISTDSASAVTSPKSGEVGDSTKPNKVPAKKTAAKKATAKKAAPGKAPAPIKRGGWVIKNGRWTLPKGKK